MPDKTVKVKVQAPWRVCTDDGKAHTGGDTVTVPESVAAEWEANGWIERVK
jgi:hypothetical protein